MMPPNPQRIGKDRGAEFRAAFFGGWIAPRLLSIRG